MYKFAKRWNKDFIAIFIIFLKSGILASDSPVLNPLFVPPNIAIGDITEIVCTIKKGTMPIEFKWLHNGKDVQAHSKYKVTSSKTSSHFYIGEIQASDIGNFTCIASNAFGADSKTENVFMEGKF